MGTVGGTIDLQSEATLLSDQTHVLHHARDGAEADIEHFDGKTTE